MHNTDRWDWLRPVWHKRNAENALKTIARINDEETLKKVALYSPALRVREQACAKIDDIPFLIELVTAVPELTIRSATTYSLQDIDGLLALLAESDDVASSRTALEHLCLAMGYDSGENSNLVGSLIQCAAARCKYPCVFAHAANALDHRFPGIYQEVLAGLIHYRAEGTEPVHLPLSPKKKQSASPRPIAWFKRFASSNLFFYLYCVIAFVIYAVYLQANGFSFSIRPPEPPLSAIEIAFLLLLMLPIWAMLFARIRKMIRD